MQKLSQCPACGSERFQRRYEGRTTRRPADPARWQVDECADCSHGFLNPQPDWADLEAYYSADYPAYQSSHGTTASDEEVVAAAKASGTFRYLPLPTGKRVLDVGCGGGFFIRICALLGAQVQGVEPNAVAADRARLSGLNVFQGTLGDFIASVGGETKFDVITASQVIEHVPEPATTLAQMKSLLAPGGTIWLSMPNGDCRWAHRLKWRWDGADLPYHLMHFSPESIARAAERAGLKVRHSYTHSVPWIVAFTMTTALRHTWGIPPRLGRFFATDAKARRIGEELDAKNEGDTIIVELEPQP